MRLFECSTNDFGKKNKKLDIQKRGNQAFQAKSSSFFRHLPTLREPIVWNDSATRRLDRARLHSRPRETFCTPVSWRTWTRKLHAYIQPISAARSAVVQHKQKSSSANHFFPSVLHIHVELMVFWRSPCFSLPRKHMPAHHASQAWFRVNCFFRALLCILWRSLYVPHGALRDSGAWLGTSLGALVAVKLSMSAF
jgi:hypothetical protein